MKQLIRIDKNSIKLNKNYGSTKTMVGSTSIINFKCETLPYFFIDGENCQIKKYEFDEEKQFNFEGIIYDEFLINRCFEEKIKGININQEIKYQHIDHNPIKKYSFKYENTIIFCDFCKEKFEVDKLLEYDNDDYYNDKVCPNCGESQCCQLDYEKII